MQILRKAGYCWVTVPDNYIAPLQLLKKGKGGAVNQLNTSIETIFSANTFALPAISPDVELTGEMAGEEIVDLKVQSDVSILQSLLKIFSKNANADFNYQNNETARFRLIDPKRNFIDIGKLDYFIGDAEMVTAAKTLVKNLKDDELYVITDIVKAKGFTLESLADKKAGAAVDIGTVAADAGASFERSTSTKAILNQNGDTYITVAVRAYRIYYDKPGFFSNTPAGFHINQEDIKIFRDDEQYPGTKLDQDITAL